MIFEVRDAQFFDLISPDAVLEQIVTGLDFTEGPIWHSLNQSVVFSDILGNSLYHWTAETGLVTLRRNSYMANGNAYDAYGRIITCEHATSRLTRTNFTESSELEVLATHYQGNQLNSPNDVVVKGDGTIYFSDPTSGRSAEFGVPREPELPFSGVYRFDPEKKALILLVDDFAKPNGLCFSRDESLLFVNDSQRQHIRVFDVDEAGLVGNGRIFANLSGDQPGVADGMKIDSTDHLYSCGPGGIHIFDPHGHCLGVINTPEPAANFVFGDLDLCSLYITATTSLYRLRVNIPGHTANMGGSLV